MIGKDLGCGCVAQTASHNIKTKTRAFVSCPILLARDVPVDALHKHPMHAREIHSPCLHVREESRRTSDSSRIPSNLAAISSFSDILAGHCGFKASSTM